MKEIKCPNCGEVFAVDETGYAQIARQVRDIEFDRELKRREGEYEQRKAGELKLARMEQKEAYDRELVAKDVQLVQKERELEQLKAQIMGQETEKKLAMSQIAQEKEKELSEKTAQILELQNRLAGKETENELKKQSLVREYEAQLKQKDEQIEYYKDFKARQSTKMVGESLEQHCLNQFNALRMTAFPSA